MCLELWERMDRNFIGRYINELDHSRSARCSDVCFLSVFVFPWFCLDPEISHSFYLLVKEYFCLFNHGSIVPDDDFLIRSSGDEI